MPLKPFKAQEWATLARGARSLAVAAEEDAKTNRNPSIRANKLSAAREYRELADRCEANAQEAAS